MWLLFSMYVCVYIGVAELQCKVLDLEEENIKKVDTILEKDAEINKLKMALGESAKERTNLQLKVADLMKKVEESASRLTMRETDLEALQSKFIVEQTAHVKGKTTLSSRLKEVRGFLDAERKLHEDMRLELAAERDLHAETRVLYEGACKALEIERVKVIAPHVESSDHVDSIVEEREAIKQMRVLLDRERAVFEHDQEVMEKERGDWTQTIELLRKQVAEYRDRSARQDSGVCLFPILPIFTCIVYYLWCFITCFVYFSLYCYCICRWGVS